ncbi:MAG: hypothetical protein ACOC3V_01280 [bacterium]
MYNSWREIIEYAYEKAKNYPEEYINRLRLEEIEIDKQGANQYWIDIANSDKKFEDNKNGLVIAFLINATDIDPIKGQRKLFVNGDDQKIDGIEIVLDNGSTISTSCDTLIKTLRGFIKAKDLSENDEVCLD